MKIPLSLGRDHAARKALPIMRVLGYFTAAIAGLTRHAVRGNAQHNPGEPLHWARGKSMDHAECVGRHSFDLMDLLAWLERNPDHPERESVLTEAEHEYDARLWRAAADSQEFYEKYRGAPVSPSSRLPEPPVVLFNETDGTCGVVCDRPADHAGVHMGREPLQGPAGADWRSGPSGADMEAGYPGL